MTGRSSSARRGTRPTSAGLLLYRWRGGRLEVLLVHPGGPFWRHKDRGAWSIPKGEIEAGEEPLAAARREFEEETGLPAPAGPFLELTPVTQRRGKIVSAWAAEYDCDPRQIRSSTVPIEWPPRSGRIQQVPEIDRAEFFPLEVARAKINPAQAAFLDELGARLGRLPDRSG